MVNAEAITRLQDEATVCWHDLTCKMTEPTDSLGALVLEQHRANFDLWHREDAARDPAAGDQVIAGVKRKIDRLNQRRNDLMERIDTLLLEAAGEQAADAPLHSETPGMMVDRLSILALKIFHTGEETRRGDAGEEHRMRNRERLAVLEEQRADLTECLDTLWREVGEGRRRFKLYRQMKMYNDPELNPVLYGKTGAAKQDGAADATSAAPKQS